MKKYLTITLLALLAFVANAATNPPPALELAPESQLFSAREFNLELGGTARIDNEQRTSDALDIGTGIAANYWITRGFGLGIRGEIDSLDHSTFDRAIARLQTRAPLWDTVAPYGFLEGGFDFERNEWGAGAGGGLEWRPKPVLQGRIGFFGEAGLEVSQTGKGRMRGAAGLRIPLSLK